PLGEGTDRIQAVRMVAEPRHPGHAPRRAASLHLHARCAPAGSRSSHRSRIEWARAQHYLGARPFLGSSDAYRDLRPCESAEHVIDPVNRDNLDCEATFHGSPKSTTHLTTHLGATTAPRFPSHKNATAISTGIGTETAA